MFHLVLFVDFLFCCCAVYKKLIGPKLGSFFPVFSSRKVYSISLCVLSLNPFWVTLLWIVFVSLSAASNSAVPWTIAHQGPLSMEFRSKNTRLYCCSLLQVSDKSPVLVVCVGLSIFPNIIFKEIKSLSFCSYVLFALLWKISWS